MKIVTQKGLTLVEAMLTLAVLGIGLAGAAKLQAYVMSSSRELRDRAAALALTRSQIEVARHRRITAQHPPIAAGGRRAVTANHVPYSLDWRLQPVQADLDRLRVKTVWPVRNRKYAFEYQTLIHEQAPARGGWRLK